MCGPPACAQVISTARTCNLILIVLDCMKPLTHKRIIERELEGFGIRLNKKPPNITFKKKEKVRCLLVCTPADRVRSGSFWHGGSRWGCEGGGRAGR
jgi:hypothetical protein